MVSNTVQWSQVKSENVKYSNDVIFSVRVSSKVIRCQLQSQDVKYSARHLSIVQVNCKGVK